MFTSYLQYNLLLLKKFIIDQGLSILCSVNMLANNLMCFSLSLIFVAQVVLSAGVNKSAADGKVFISGDHNELVVSTAQETKIAALSEQAQKMSQRLTTLASI